MYNIFGRIIIVIGDVVEDCAERITDKIHDVISSKGEE